MQLHTPSVGHTLMAFAAQSPSAHERATKYSEMPADRKRRREVSYLANKQRRINHIPSTLADESTSLTVPAFWRSARSDNFGDISKFNEIKQLVQAALDGRRSFFEADIKVVLHAVEVAIEQDAPPTEFSVLGFGHVPQAGHGV